MGNVAVTFQPLDKGHMKSLPVKPDGTFQGELHTGTYAYSIMASSSPETQQATQQSGVPSFWKPAWTGQSRSSPGSKCRSLWIRNV